MRYYSERINQSIVLAQCYSDSYGFLFKEKPFLYNFTNSFEKWRKSDWKVSIKWCRSTENSLPHSPGGPNFSSAMQLNTVSQALALVCHVAWQAALSVVYPMGRRKTMFIFFILRENKILSTQMCVSLLCICRELYLLGLPSTIVLWYTYSTVISRWYGKCTEI